MTAPTPRRRAGSWATLLLFGVVTLGTDLALARAYRRLVPPVDFRAIERTYRRAADPYHHGLAPNVDLVGAWGDRRYPLRTNALGFKDATCRSVALAPTGRRVLLIGDSFTEGVGFPFEETFAGRIAAALARDGVEVLNAAAVSYAPSIYARKVQHLIEDVGLGFDELVVFLDVSDVNDEATMYRVDADDRVVATSEIGRLWIGDAPAAPEALDDWLVQRSIIARAVRTAWRSARAAARGTAVCPGTDRDPLATVTNVEAARWSFDDAAFAERGARGLAQAEAAMDRLHALLQRHGRGLTVVVYPWPDHVLRRDLGSRQVTAWRAWAARHDVRFLDLFPAFIDGDDPAAVIARDYIPCDVHFSAAGNRRMADAFLAAYAPAAPPTRAAGMRDRGLDE
jgi:hypothetical protein